MHTATAGTRVPLKFWLDPATYEPQALEQAQALSALPFAVKHIVVLPDSHVGYGMPIGCVLATDGTVVPNAVGVDISCGVQAEKLSCEGIDQETVKRIMGRIRETIPLGFNHHQDEQPWDGFAEAPDLPVIRAELSSAKRQLGTLGGGNHFIEIQTGDDGHVWLMLHSGSRNFGLKIAKYYHEAAVRLCESFYSEVPKDLSFLPHSSPLWQEYMDAMQFACRFAHASRNAMMDRMVEACYLETASVEVYRVDVNHNYAAMEHHFGKNVLVHRKGAIRSQEGEVGIIPGSMGSASYITRGLGNPDSFCSSSHGAGRAMGRTQAKERLSLETEQAKMEGIVHGLRNQGDLDEAPGAYKDIDEVMDNQADLTKIEVTLRPIGSIKG